MRKLYKATIIIWSEFNPAEVELEALAREAEEGEAYCSRMESTLVADPAADPDWDGTDFFGEDEEG